MKHLCHRIAATCGAIAATCLAASAAFATSMERPVGLSGLVKDAHAIVVGTVSKVTQGRHAALPFVEIEIQVSDSLRGSQAETVTFRQINIPAPLAPENGRRYIGGTTWMPTYTVGEQVMVFLGRKGSQGFRTTVGLQQGKFTLSGGTARNGHNNKALFQGVTFRRDARLNEREASMVKTTEGAVAAETFVGLVRRAVSADWWGHPVETSPTSARVQQAQEQP
ncbi:MAG: hypothetical protein ACREAA_04575 [Candidatus Polarisedimenticolia bacterium]